LDNGRLALSNLEEQLDRDLKKALLAGQTQVVATLRGVKSAILYAKLASGSRGNVMPEPELVAVLQKEARKRQESADLYREAGSLDRAEVELIEKKLIEQYLPDQLSEPELRLLVDEVIKSTHVTGSAAMGAVIGQLKQRVAGRADGALIARLVKERLRQ